MHADRSDAELVHLARLDQTAFEALYRRHVRRLIRFAARRCTRPDDVADVVAATFVVVLEAPGSYDPAKGEVLPWMLGIARHQAASVNRGARRERDALARVAGRRALEADEFLELEQHIDAARARPQVEAAMASLPSRDRDVLWLASEEGLGSAEAAQVLGLSPPAFRMRLMRARRRMRRALSDPSSSAHPRQAASQETPT